jgi:hypothetical protein
MWYDDVTLPSIPHAGSKGLLSTHMLVKGAFLKCLLQVPLGWGVLSSLQPFKDHDAIATSCLALGWCQDTMGPLGSWLGSNRRV